ncbi:hypothetical protein [Yoonia sp. BS5-3]|uniref:HEAT repeat domain-containing protein n=1 Tax=Yoonia phaeophyticola TaxID=3137369 RepID=A0ABZ2V229_9RHOB
MRCLEECRAGGRGAIRLAGFAALQNPCHGTDTADGTPCTLKSFAAVFTSMANMFRIFRPKRHWPPSGFRPPWAADCVALYDHLRRLQKAGRNSDTEPLPDEARLSKDAAHGSAAVLDAFQRLERHRNGPSFDAFYDASCRTTLEDIWEDVLNHFQVVGISDPGTDMLEWVLHNSPDREPVKLAIFVLGGLGRRHLVPVFETLGRHGVFAKHAGAALLCNLPEDDARAAILKLAKMQTGAGRLDLVDLLTDKLDEPFRRWLLRDGLQAEIGNHRLAVIALTKGQPLAQLRQDAAPSDQALLCGTADMLTILLGAAGSRIAPGYHADMLAIVRLWQQLVSAHPATLQRVVAAKVLYEHIAGDNALPEWTDADRAQIQEDAVQYLAAAENSILDKAGLSGIGQTGFPDGADISTTENLDPWEAAYQRQSNDPSLNLWAVLAEGQSADQQRRCIDLAIAQSPLDDIATGPDSRIADGKTWEDYPALDRVLSRVASAHKRAWPLVKAALRSPHPRFRVSACDTLRNWGKKNWPGDANKVLIRAIDEEPDPDIHLRMVLLRRDDAMYDRRF